MSTAIAVRKMRILTCVLNTRFHVAVRCFSDLGTYFKDFKNEFYLVFQNKLTLTDTIHTASRVYRVRHKKTTP